MQFQEFLQSIIGRKSSDAIVWNSMFGSTFRTFDLALDIIDQALHARLHARRRADVARLERERCAEYEAMLARHMRNVSKIWSIMMQLWTVEVLVHNAKG